MHYKCEKCGHEQDESKLPLQLRPADIMKAIDIAAKYGLGPTPTFDPDLIGELGEAVAEVVGMETWMIAREKWVPILGKHLTG